MPADAITYNIDSELYIGSINLNAPVTKLQLEDAKLNTPDDIIGSYSRNDSTTLLIGHSTTIFKDLPHIKKDDYISFDGTTYKVKSILVKAKQNISMNELLKPSTKETIILMTCAGRNTEAGFTHRLIVKAEKL